MLTASSSPTLSRYADALADAVSCEVVMISDNPPVSLPSVANCIHIPDADAVRHYCHHSNCMISKDPSAWDKMFYFLSEVVSKHFDYAWIMEDDVLFSDVKIAAELVSKYAQNKSDLIARNLFTPDERSDWPNWKHASQFEQRFQAGSLVQLCRLSRGMVATVRDFAIENKGLSFIETMLPSLARQRQLKIETMDFLNYRRFRYRPCFNLIELMELWGDNLSTGIFHPVKIDELRVLSLTGPAFWKLKLFKTIGPLLTRSQHAEARRRAWPPQS